MASDLIDGELDPEEAGRLQAHIESCPTCPRLYRALVAVTAELTRRRSMAAEKNQDPSGPDVEGAGEERRTQSQL
jgi:RNA polymerase sigma-70 factor, ECF subfamily